MGTQEIRGGEVVVLLHGLARTSRSMNRMRSALQAAGYAVVSLRYPSTKKTVEQLAAEDVAPVVANLEASGARRIHFVTHSLGGIVLRCCLAQRAPDRLGRIVMLGPPNRGSEVVDRFGRYGLFGWLNGPAGRQLGTAAGSLPNRLPNPPGEVGVIAGTRSINWILSAMIPGPNDGKVSVERTKLQGMADFVTVPAAHPFLMRNPRAIALTLAFLRHGRLGAAASSFPDPALLGRHKDRTCAPCACNRLGESSKRRMLCTWRFRDERRAYPV